MNRPLVLGSAALALSLVGASAVTDFPPLLLWNPTPSAPVGLWRLTPGAVANGDWVAALPPAAIAVWLDRTGRLPCGLPLIKKVAATAGDIACRDHQVITVNGQIAARVRPYDAALRELPSWGGCRILGPGELLLLNSHPDSLDGRYLGPTEADQVIGRARLVWRR